MPFCAGRADALDGDLGAEYLAGDVITGAHGETADTLKASIKLMGLTNREVGKPNSATEPHTHEPSVVDSSRHGEARPPSCLGRENGSGARATHAQDGPVVRGHHAPCRTRPTRGFRPL